jgi:hypothetical protein
MIMLSRITKIKLELMAYEAMFATPIPLSVRVLYMEVREGQLKIPSTFTCWCTNWSEQAANSIVQSNALEFSLTQTRATGKKNWWLNAHKSCTHVQLLRRSTTPTHCSTIWFLHRIDSTLTTLSATTIRLSAASALLRRRCALRLLIFLSHQLYFNYSSRLVLTTKLVKSGYHATSTTSRIHIRLVNCKQQPSWLHHQPPWLRRSSMNQSKSIISMIFFFGLFSACRTTCRRLLTCVCLSTATISCQ